MTILAYEVRVAGRAEGVKTMTIHDALSLLSAVILQGDRLACLELADALADCGEPEAASELRAGRVGGVRVVLSDRCEWGNDAVPCDGRPVGFGAMGKHQGSLCEFHRSLCFDIDAHQCSNCGNAEGRI